MTERTFEIPIGLLGGQAEAGAATATLFALEVTCAGTEGDPDVAILLHGGPGASHDYLRPQLDQLGSPARRLIYYDQRGGGRSPLPADWPAGGLAEHLRDLSYVAHVIESASHGRPPILIGYSWGGLLALHFALEEPSAVARLLLISPAPPNIGAREVMRARLAAAAARPDVQAFAASIDRSDPRQRFAAAVAGYFVEPKLALGVTPFMVRQRAERGVWSSLGDYDLRPRLSRLAVPTRIIHGIEDPVPVESARETARLSGAELIELPRCGHVPYVEAPEPFFKAARTFLDVNASSS